MRAAFLLVAGLSACTDLDALYGREPPLPWSTSAPRGLANAPDGGWSPRRVRTEVVSGQLQLDTDVPIATADCTVDEPMCTDVDRDGLVDEWEDIALDRLRPFVRIDEGDPLRVDPLGAVGSVGRVTPTRDPAGPRIRLFLVLGYSRDYGRCTFDDHLGDSERVVLDLAPVGRGAVRVVRAFTAAHEGTGEDASGLFTGGDLRLLEYAADPLLGEPRWAVYSSRSKHATFASAGLCEAIDGWFCGGEDCAAGRSISPPNELLLPVVNSGEPEAPRALQMMGEPVWDDVAFCGGLGHDDGPCASPLREKLLYDPFTGEDLWPPVVDGPVPLGSILFLTQPHPPVHAQPSRP